MPGGEYMGLFGTKGIRRAASKLTVLPGDLRHQAPWAILRLFKW